MRIKGRDLVDRQLWQAHLVAQCAQVAGRKVMVAILDEVEKFDQEIGATRPRAEMLTNQAERIAVKLSSLGESSGTLPRSYVQGPLVLASVRCRLLPHATSSPFSRDPWSQTGQRLSRM